MTEHTPTPWMAATKYSSMVGVPIVNQQGKRIGNTALPDMPHEWDHMKRQAEIDAAFIIKAVNNHDALVNALQLLEKAEEFHANCDECGGEEVPELCPVCFPLFDDARIARRTALAAVSSPLGSGK